MYVLEDRPVITLPMPWSHVDTEALQAIVDGFDIRIVWLGDLIICKKHDDRGSIA